MQSMQQQQQMQGQCPPRHHQRQRTRPLSGKPGRAQQQQLLVIQPGLQSLPYQQQQTSQHTQSQKGLVKVEIPSSSHDRYHTQSSSLINVDTPMQHHHMAAFKHHAGGGSRPGGSGVSQQKQRPQVRNSLSQKRVSRRDSREQRGRHHSRRQSQLKTITSAHDQQQKHFDARDKKMLEIVQTHAQSNQVYQNTHLGTTQPTASHVPGPAINNNITVNVNLNVTAEDAEQQKKIAQQIVQAATQGLPQATRQTPFTQFMSDPRIVNQAMPIGLHYMADQQPVAMGTSSIVLNTTEKISAHQQPHHMQHTVSSSQSKRSNQQNTQPNGSNTLAIRSESKQPQYQNNYPNRSGTDKSKRSTIRPQSAKRVPSSSTQGYSGNATSLSSLTQQQLTAFGFHAVNATGKLSVDGLAIEGVKKQQTIQQPAKRYHLPPGGQQPPQFNPDLAYVMECSQAINQQSQTIGKNGQRAPDNGTDLLRSISMAGPSMASTLNIMNAVRSSQNGMKQQESKASIATCNSPLGRMSPLHGNTQNIEKSQPVKDQPIPTSQSASVQQPVALFSSFKTQALPMEASQVGINFKGFSHVGKPVAIKHPGAVTDVTDCSISGEIQKQSSSVQRLSQKIIKIADQNSPLVASVPFSQPGRTSEPVRLKSKAQAVDPAYADFQRLIQENIQHQQAQQQQQQQMQLQQQQVQSSEAYNQHGRPSQQPSSTNFNRPGRKVVQRPPSAKQKLASQKSSAQKSVTPNNQGPLSSQSITLRQRGAPHNNNPKSGLHLTAQQQHLKAVRNQKDAMSVFIDKKVQQNDMSKSSNQPNHHLQSHLQGHRDLQGLINATGGPHNEQHYGQVQQQPGQQQVPIFIKKSAGPQQSHTLTNELRKQQLVSSVLGPAKQQLFLGDRISDSALHSKNKDRIPSVSPNRKQQQEKNNWRIDYAQVRDSMSVAQQKLVQENINLMTSIRQETDEAAMTSTKVPAKKLDIQSNQSSMPMTAHSMTLQAPQSRLSQHEPTSNTNEKSVSSNTIQQKPADSKQLASSFDSRHQPTKPTTKIIDSKTVSLGQVQTQLLQQYGQQLPYTVMSTTISPNKQNMLVLVVPQQSLSSVSHVAPGAPIAPAAADATQKNSTSTSLSAKRPLRQARPKSGIPLNRAPFRPSGVAQPSSDIISQSKRGHHSRGDSMRKSGTLGRTTIIVGEKSSAVEETKQRPASSKYDSNRNTLFPRNRENNSVQQKGHSKQEKKRDNSYGEQSYGSADDDGSYYSSGYDDEDEKEQLEYDDQKEYPSASRLSPDPRHPSRVLLNPPAALTAQGTGQAPVTISTDMIEAASKKTELPKIINNKTIQAKGSNILVAAVSKKAEERYETFGTPEKNLIGNNSRLNRDQNGIQNDFPIEKLEKVSDLMRDISGDEDDLSAGYLNGEGAEEEGECTKPLRKINENSRDFLPRISPIPDKKVLLTLSSKSPDIHKGDRCRNFQAKYQAELKVADTISPGTLQNLSERSNIGLKPQLGVSSSAKVIENKHNNYIDQSQSASKKSIQLSDSCPKEQVRRLFQRPGLMSSYDGLNSRLRSMSIRKSNENQSTTSQYQLRQAQENQAKGGNRNENVKTDSVTTLEHEMIQAHKKAENYNETDPYTQKMPVYLCKSPFIGRPPTVFFQYPPGVSDTSKSIDRDHIFKMKQHKFKMKFKIAESVHTYNCVVNALCWNGFSQTDGSQWNMLWSAPLKPETLRNYDMYKHCNHFAGTWQLGRKDLMFRNISAQIREFGEDYNIVPKTWILPYDLRLFQKEREDTTGKNLWILKPAASSCGRGIKILSKHSSIPKKGPYVVNQYIMKPHLLGGYKYDLRLYVLVTSFEPLMIYMYQDGLVRFATQPYTTKNRKSKFAHLTNFSINKKASNYKKAGQNNDEEEESSSKWRLKTLIRAFKSQGLNWNEIWEKIKDLVIKAVISVEPTLANNLNRASRNRHLCYEIFGFDVIIDHNMKPWLLEVNVLPSLSSSSQLDKKIKTSLMTDVFSTIGMVPYNRKKFERAQEFNYWNRFSGLTKRAGGGSAVTDSGKKQSRSKHDDSQQLYFGSTFDQQMAQERNGSKSKINSSDAFKNYGNVPMNKKEEDDEESSEGENIAWTHTQNNMAQSQSNYVQSRIRSVKELQTTYDWNIEEQLVIVEFCEQYCRKGNFEMIFPRKNNAERYRKYFKVLRASNTIIWKWLKLSPIFSTDPDQNTRTTKKKGQKNNQGQESRNQLETSTATGKVTVEPRSRFSVLKDFKVRTNCANHYLEAIKHI